MGKYELTLCDVGMSGGWLSFRPLPGMLRSERVVLTRFLIATTATNTFAGQAPPIPCGRRVEVYRCSLRGVYLLTLTAALGLLLVYRAAMIAQMVDIS